MSAIKYYTLGLHQHSSAVDMARGAKSKFDIEGEFCRISARQLTHSFPTAKQLFPGFFLHFSMLFLKFKNLNMIAMSNSHLVLRKETFIQYFEE